MKLDEKMNRTVVGGFSTHYLKDKTKYFAAANELQNDFAAIHSKNGNFSFYSHFALRDDTDEIRAILVFAEIAKKPSLFQVYLSNNQKFDWSIGEAISRFLFLMGAEQLVREGKIGVARSTDHEWHSLSNLRDNLTFENLFVDNCPISSLPRGLRVTERLDISETEIKHLPSDLNVSYLTARHTAIEEIPDSLRNFGRLDLEGSKIKKLPDGLRVRYDLNLCNTPITSLPRGLHVGGSLKLDNPNLTTLPDDLFVGDTLDIFSTGITSLPEGLCVQETIIMNSNVKELPASISNDVTIVLEDDVISARQFRKISAQADNNPTPKA